MRVHLPLHRSGVGAGVGQGIERTSLRPDGRGVEGSMKRRLPVLALSLGLLLTGCQENIAAEIVENATLFPAPEAGEGVLGGLKKP